MKLLAVLLLLAGCCSAQYTIPHSTGALAAPWTGPLFSLSGSTLTISNCGSKSVFYSTATDGSPVTTSSVLYSAPITVTSGELVRAICETFGAQQSQTQNSSTGATCQTVPGGSYTGPPSITCSSSGGGIIGTPSNVIWTFATPATMEITAPASQSGQTQALLKFLYSGSADPSAGRCDACTQTVLDVTFTVTGSGLANQEFDSPWFNSTQGINAQNGMQCELSSGHIEVDSGNADGWTADTSIPCSSWTDGTTHHVVKVVTDEWTNTACTGGNGCASYGPLWIDGTSYPMSGTYSNSQGFNTQSGETAWGWQFQPDLSPTGGSAVTSGWTVSSATISLNYNDASPVASITIP